ncbi:hypothetical protein ECG_08309 [Echinococcus granulosus]|nr:hypothetical protein ECG_08309 [Echinococcus granulosus]
MHNYIMDRILEKPEISAPAVTPSGHIALPQAAEAPAIAAPGYALWPLAAVCTTGAQPLSTNRLLWERHKQVKILVPNCTAGLVIGKQGSYVSEIKEATGSSGQRVSHWFSLRLYHAPPSSNTQAQTLLSSRHPAAAATAAIVRQKSDGGIPMTGAYYHNALQATYFAAAAAAAAAAADYQQRLAAAGYQQQQHRGMEAVHSGEASGASSTAGGMYASPTGLESPLDPSSFPLVASSPPPPPSASSLNTFGGSGSGVTAAFFPPLRTSSPLSTTPATTATAAWLRSRGFSEEAVAEITHAMSTLSAHGSCLLLLHCPNLPPPPASFDAALRTPPNEETETEAVVSGGTDSGVCCSSIGGLLCSHAGECALQWDPRRRNVLGSTPLDLALGKHDAYLPVVWPLVMASSDVYEDSSANPTLTSLLLRPPTTTLSQSLVGYVDFTTSTIILLFELIHCTPNLLVEPWTTPEARRCPECLAIGDTEEAICLKDQNRIFDFPVRYACWLWHRYRATCEVPGQLSPSSLLTCCRVVIRRTIMKNLSINGSVMDYAKALKSLNVPSWMLAFLAFREMWPIVNPKHKLQFRQRQHEKPATEHLLQPAYDVYDLVV